MLGPSKVSSTINIQHDLTQSLLLTLRHRLPPQSSGSSSSSTELIPAVVRDAHPDSCAIVEAPDTKKDVVLKPASSPKVILRAATPKWDQMATDLQTTADKHPEGQDFLQFVNTRMFYDKVPFIDHYGNKKHRPLDIAEKMEKLLDICIIQREKALKIMQRRRRAGQPAIDEKRPIDDASMKIMKDRWTKDIGSWMNWRNKGEYSRLLRSKKYQKARSFIRSRFEAYCFHLSGCKFLLHWFIKYDVVKKKKEALNEALIECIKEHAAYQASPKYLKAREDSKQKAA